MSSTFYHKEESSLPYNLYWRYHLKWKNHEFLIVTSEKQCLNIRFVLVIIFPDFWCGKMDFADVCDVAKGKLCPDFLTLGEF